MHSEEDEQIYRGRLTFAKVVSTCSSMIRFLLIPEAVTSDDEKVTIDHEVKEGLGVIRIDIYDGRYGREIAWSEPVIAKADVGVAQESHAK